jgi:hypothetical protein
MALRAMASEPCFHIVDSFVVEPIANTLRLGSLRARGTLLAETQIAKLQAGQGEANNQQ